ncbi:MAG: hypothetical protein ACFC03_01540 [Candidatus Malihini olakiniferum]
MKLPSFGPAVLTTSLLALNTNSNDFITGLIFLFQRQDKPRFVKITCASLPI